MHYFKVIFYLELSVLIPIYLESSAKKTKISSKPIISPKIVINRKNYVFKEAIEQLNKDRINLK